MNYMHSILWHRYTKTKTGTYVDKVYINFRDLNVLEDWVECQSFAIISTDSLVIYSNKYYLQVYLDNCEIIRL